MTANVLLIEDDPGHIELTLRAFAHTRNPPRVKVFTHGEDALEYLARATVDGNPPLPHLVVLDLGLPGMRGAELLRRLRDDPHTRRIPVVVCTVSREESDLDECLALGANGYVLKPVDEERLAETLRVVGEYWLALNSLPS